jgi:hypothetical protein
MIKWLRIRYKRLLVALYGYPKEARREDSYEGFFIYEKGNVIGCKVNMQCRQKRRKIP